jgi:hypothetical protein
VRLDHLLSRDSGAITPEAARPVDALVLLIEIVR